MERAVREEFEDAQVMMLHGASHIFMHYPNEIQRIARFRKALRDLAESGSDRVFAAAAKLLSRIASRHTK